MHQVRHIKGLLFIFIASIFLVGWSCKSDPKASRTLSMFSPDDEDTLSHILQYEGSLFPIPSPHQIIHLIKAHNIPFSQEFLNPYSNLKYYNTNFKRALNFGTYGTNLSYLNIYKRTPETIAYLNVLKRLANDLGIGMVFEEDLFRRIEKNVNNPDSIVYLISTSYRMVDGFLHESNRSDIGALILAGGWIESISLLTKIGLKSSNREIINRVGEQKYPLDNLIEILSPYYYDSQSHTELIDALIDLGNEFDGIIYSYSYEEPVIDEENKIMYINSQSRVVMSEYHLSIINQKIDVLRKLIIE